jgi:hypothetical protein
MNHSNSFLKRKRRSSEDHDSIDIKKEDGEYNMDHKRNFSRDYGKSSYRTRPNNSYSPLNKRRSSYDSPRGHSSRHNDDYYYERKSNYYDRRESSDLFSEESSFHELRRDNRAPVRIKRSYNFLICLPKNYFRFIDQSFDKLLRQVDCFKSD